MAMSEWVKNFVNLDKLMKKAIKKYPDLSIEFLDRHHLPEFHKREREFCRVILSSSTHENSTVYFYLHQNSTVPAISMLSNNIELFNYHFDFKDFVEHYRAWINLDKHSSISFVDFLKPLYEKAEAEYKEFEDNDDYCKVYTTTEVGKLIGMSAVKINRLLVEEHVIDLAGNLHLLPEYRCNLYYKHRHNRSWYGPTGWCHGSSTPVWSEAGVEFIKNLVNKKGE